ncbi:MAG: questin oxidase family protein [Pseudomonadota bacterium]
MVSNECSRLLSLAAECHPLYGNRLSNHLPMALLALDRMGAAPEQMRIFFKAYRPRLQKLNVADEPLSPLASLGSGTGFEGALRYFQDLTSQQGAEPVLRQWLPILAPGLAASAFHSMIRLAYALEAENQTEICFALAYWTTEYCPFSLSMSPVERTLESIVASLSSSVAGYRFAPGLITSRMTEIAAHPLVKASAIQPQRITLTSIATFALSAYLQKGDFTSLHMVTGCHAFRVIQGYFDDHTLALRYLWQAIAIAYLTAESIYPDHGQPRLDPGNYSWTDCIERARCSLDDHVIKLSYTAWQESLAYNDDRYLAIAVRKNFS